MHNKTRSLSLGCKHQSHLFRPELNRTAITSNLSEIYTLLIISTIDLSLSFTSISELAYCRHGWHWMSTCPQGCQWLATRGFLSAWLTFNVNPAPGGPVCEVANDWQLRGSCPHGWHSMSTRVVDCKVANDCQPVVLSVRLTSNVNRPVIMLYSSYFHHFGRKRRLVMIHGIESIYTQCWEKRMDSSVGAFEEHVLLGTSDLYHTKSWSQSSHLLR
jgi:hypothetical protein